MNLTCPSCGIKIEALQEPFEEKELRCSGCRSLIRLQVKVSIVESPKEDEEAAPTVLDPKMVLVAVEGEVTNEIISELLLDAKFQVTSATSAGEVLARVSEKRPSVAIVDVGIPDIFESVVLKVETLEHFKGVKIILLSSIHNKTRYKREPDNLYGAHDYIERHHIQDELVGKVMSLSKGSQGAYVSLGSQSGSESPPMTESTPVQNETPPPAMEKPSTKPEPVKGDLTSHDMAKRLARLIISDIALYNQKRIEEGIRSGNIRDLLKDELEEGLRLYQGRIPREIHDGTNYYEEAITDFIQRQKDKIAG